MGQALDVTTLQPAPGLILAGCQAGDEGKGRFTDLYAADAWAVVRYQGGPHTGHSVTVGGTRYCFVQLPSGCLDGTLGILGNGCVVDPIALIEEIDAPRRASKPGS